MDPLSSDSLGADPSVAVDEECASPAETGAGSAATTKDRKREFVEEGIRMRPVECTPTDPGGGTMWCTTPATVTRDVTDGDAPSTPRFDE